MLILSIFVSFVSSKYLINHCVAPTNLQEPLENGTLLQVQVIIRHGARTPGEDFHNSKNLQEWYCDVLDSHSPRLNPAPVQFYRNYRDEFDPRLIEYKPTCREKDLLTLGMQQHFELGQAYKKLYHEKLHFLPKNINPSFFFARASESDRTLRSAISFIQGMFPPASPNEVIPLVTDTEAAGLMHPKSKWCKKLKGSVEYMHKTDQFKSFFDDFTKKFRKKYESEVSGKWDPSRVKKFCSWLVMTQCTGHEIPSNISQGMQTSCMTLVNYHQFMQHDNDKYKGIASSPFFREMFRIADNAITSENHYKFVLFSSHDTALAAFLDTLGYDYHDKPAIQVRSHLAFELWEIDGSVYARYSFNGEPIKISFLNNKTLFPYAMLKGEMARLGYLSHCFIPEWE